jgi:hypothetical protein
MRCTVEEIRLSMNFIRINILLMLSMVTQCGHMKQTQGLCFTDRYQVTSGIVLQHRKQA